MKRINKNRMEALTEKGAMLVDLRSPVAFRDGHVAGAVNLPLRNFINKLMGTDKKTTVIIYGVDPADVTISQAHNYALQMGFQNIFVSDYNTLISNVDHSGAPKTRGPKRG